MKLSATILTAAFIAAMPAAAFAQAGGAAGGGGAASGASGSSGAGVSGAGGDPAGGPHRMGRGTDDNPTSPGANPTLGNSAASPTQRYGAGTSDDIRWGGRDATGPMSDSPVSGRR
jgi:hypothetical protein